MMSLPPPWGNLIPSTLEMLRHRPIHVQESHAIQMVNLLIPSSDECNQVEEGYI